MTDVSDLYVYFHLFYNNHINVTSELWVVSLILFILFFPFVYVKAFRMCVIFTYIMISYIMIMTKHLCLGIHTTTLF